MYHLALRNTTVRTRTWSTTQQPRTYPKTTNFCVIIEGANKMAGKGQITSERASSGRQ
jgi:hypothetical protein